jgi:hypothetical protein
MNRWAESGLSELIWKAFLDELNDQQLLDWDDVFMDGTFRRGKRVHCLGKTKRGKGTQWMLLVDSQGLPLACRTASASPAEVTLVEDVTTRVIVAEEKILPISDRAYNSNPQRQRSKMQGSDLV